MWRAAVGEPEDELEAERPGDKFNALLEGEKGFGKCQSESGNIRY
jgi:hypothetical protein